MNRVEVAVGFTVVDYEAGIGGEGYDPPKPKRQKPVDSVDQYQEPIVIGPGIKEWHDESVRTEGLKTASQIVVAAAAQEQIEEHNG